MDTSGVQRAMQTHHKTHRTDTIHNNTRPQKTPYNHNHTRTLHNHTRHNTLTVHFTAEAYVRDHSFIVNSSASQILASAWFISVAFRVRMCGIDRSSQEGS